MKEYYINTQERFIGYLIYNYVWKYQLENIHDALDMYVDECIMNENKIILT